MGEEKIITIGICLEGTQQKRVGKSSGLLSSMIEKESENNLVVTNLKHNFVVSEYLRPNYIRVYLCHILNKYLKELKCEKGNLTRDNLSARNDKTIDYFTNKLIAELAEYGFKYIEKVDSEPSETYYYSNAKSKENQKYVENFKSWYSTNTHELLYGKEH